MARTELRTHPKFRRLVKRLNLPSPYVIGLLETMWHCCYETKSSKLGSPEDVELAAEWPGKPGAFFDAIKDDWLDEKDGEYHVHDLADHAPRYVKRKLLSSISKDLRKIRAPSGRSMGAQWAQDTDTDTDTDKDSGDVSPGTAPKKRKPAKTQPTGVHAKLIKHFTDAWREKYGAVYPFRDSRDGANFKWIRKQIHDDFEIGVRVIDKFLACDDPFIVQDRHSPGMLVSQFRKFIIPSDEERLRERVRRIADSLEDGHA